MGRYMMLALTLWTGSLPHRCWYIPHHSCNTLIFRVLVYTVLSWLVPLSKCTDKSELLYAFANEVQRGHTGIRQPVCRHVSLTLMNRIYLKFVYISMHVYENNEVVHLLFWVRFLNNEGSYWIIFFLFWGCVLCCYCPEYILKTIYSLMITNSLFLTIQGTEQGVLVRTVLAWI